MRLVKEKRSKYGVNGFARDGHTDPKEQDVSFVYKPGKEKDFQVLPSPSQKNTFELERLGSWIVVVIISWMIILGAVSLVGIEIGTVEISVSLVASFIFALFVHFLNVRSKNSQRS